MSTKIRHFIFDNKATIFFLVLCILGIAASGQPISFVLDELLTRIGRNTFLVLALLIPVQAGMGLNFAIVIGAMAAQIAVFFVTLLEVKGIFGFLLCMVISTPLSIVFGYLVGSLFNKMKGAEMIGGIILGYFASGLYQLLFLFIIGGVIPIQSTTLIISSGIGVKNTIDLVGGLKYALDDLLRLSLLQICEFGFYAVILGSLAILGLNYRRDLKSPGARKVIFVALGALLVYVSTYIPYIETLFASAKIPAVTYLAIGMLYLFNYAFMKTRLGQNMRTVGQSMTVATSSGINVDKTRLIAIVISTVFASYGQLILLQNLGTFQTYGAHEYIGLFAIASLLVGGASVHKASSKQGVIGVILFHTLFIVSPIAGKNLFNSAQLGEYFRVFIAYSVIAVSLAMHAWKRKKA